MSAPSRRGWRRGLGLLAALSLVVGGLGLWLGCSSSVPLGEGLRADLAQELGVCEALEDEPRDWCAYWVTQQNSLKLRLSGEEVYALCQRLQTDEPHGWCVERAMGLRSPPPSAACETIRFESARASCQLGVADRTLAQAMDQELEQLIDACEGLPALRSHCYAHLVQRRTPVWEAGGRDLFLQELEVLVGRVEDIGDMSGLGHNVGAAVVALGGAPWSEAPCVALPAGSVSRRRCEARVGDPRRGADPEPSKRAAHAKQGPELP